MLLLVGSLQECNLFEATPTLKIHSTAFFSQINGRSCAVAEGLSTLLPLTGVELTSQCTGTWARRQKEGVGQGSVDGDGVFYAQMGSDSIVLSKSCLWLRRI